MNHDVAVIEHALTLIPLSKSDFFTTWAASIFLIMTLMQVTIGILKKDPVMLMLKVTVGMVILMALSTYIATYFYTKFSLKNEQVEEKLLEYLKPNLSDQYFVLFKEAYKNGEHPKYILEGLKSRLESETRNKWSEPL